ncbi:MAG: Gldg family protein, partial [Opitutales bacterium]
MSIWADERRQGTDELLLTLPGSDLDVVIGKYLGVVAIFSVSLVFSLVANTIALFYLGTPDLGLLVSTYFGYWFVGLAMLAVGMMASFMTANLTVAFILGVAFNTPLALLADWEWGIAANFLDFSRGIISVSGIVFFTGVALAVLYICSVLLGRRHWAGGRDGTLLSTHYLARAGAALVVALSLATVFKNNDFIRLDATEERLSTLSEGSLELLETLEGKGSKVDINAFVSPAEAMPESYVQTRINLLSALRELDRESKNVSVTIHVIDAEDNASATAEKYGVVNQNGVNPPLFVQEQGQWMPWAKDLYLGLVFKGDSGQQTLPFLYKGLPVEYEIMRTLMTVGGSTLKKKVGIFKTDAPMMGSAGMGMMGISMGGGSPPWEFVAELRKQYDVQEVTGGPIRKGDYDALVVVQPSTLEDEKLQDLLTAIKAGIPTAIFEDPLPLINGSFTGTYEPRRNNQGGGGPGQPPPPAPSKGDISQLWSLLGVHFNVEPAARVEKVRKELTALKASANRTLAPLRGRFPVIGKFFAKLNELDR